MDHERHNPPKPGYSGHANGDDNDKPMKMKPRGAEKKTKK